MQLATNNNHTGKAHSNVI